MTPADRTQVVLLEPETPLPSVRPWHRSYRDSASDRGRLKWRSGAVSWPALIGVLFAAATACSENGDKATTSNGVAKNQGGEGGTAAATNGGVSGELAVAGAKSSAGDASVAPSHCTTPARWAGKLAHPAQLVSVGKPVFTNSSDQANGGLVVDGQYKIKSGLLLTPTATASAWVSIHLGAGHNKLLLNWQDSTSSDFGPSNYAQTDFKRANGPSGYLIKVSSDSTNGDDGTWSTVVTVTDSPVRSRRTHVFDFGGMQWVRFEVTASPMVDVAGTPTMQAVRLDEIALHDVSAVGPDDLSDTWYVLGDSITKMSFDRARMTNELDKLIAVRRPGYTPAILEAGNGGETLSDLLRHLKTEQWLSYGEGLKFVTLAYGTNDSWGRTAAAATTFEATLREVVQLLLDAKRVPILARIPWNNVSPNLAAFNAVVDKLQREYDLPCGPDLYTWFANHQTELGTDKVHPGPVGAVSIHRLYGEALLPLYPGQ